MGLFSDILEEINESEYAPIMTTGWSYPSRYAYSFPIVSKRAIGERVKKYKPHDERYEEKKPTPEELRKDLNDFEIIKYCNRINEKQILFARNKCEIRSIIINDLMDEMLNMIDETCAYINHVKATIAAESLTINYRLPLIDEDQLKKELLSTIYRTLYISIKNGLPMSLGLFRKMVKDLIQLTNVLDSSAKNKTVDKFYVENWFKIISGEHAGAIVCHNCGRPLIKTIPYCFNCFEGRYS